MEEHDGVMIAFYPSPEMALALHTALGGNADMVEPAEMHLTLVYLGNVPDLEAQGITAEKVLGVLRDLSGVLNPVAGQISGVGRFTNTHLPGLDALVLLVDSPQLPDFRMVLTNELSAQGIPYAQNHGFTPHITLMYISPEQSADFRPPVADIAFDKLTLAWGNQKIEVPLTPAEIAPAVESPADLPPETTPSPEADMPSMMEKALSIFRRPRKDEIAVGFKALGGGWWLATFTNNFEDRHKEILAEDGHDRYIARADRGLVPMPVLDHWHIDGSEHGKAVWVGRAGHMVFAAGRFDATPMGRAAEKTYQRHPGKYKVSQKFLYPRWAEKNGVIYDYNAYKISTLPDGTEANPFTGFISIEEDKLMPLSEEKKKSLRELFGSEEVFGEAMKQIDAMEAQGDKLAKLGVKFKEYADLTQAATPVPTSQVPADLLLSVLEGQKSLVDSFDFVEKALEGMKAHLDAKVADLAKAEAEFKEKAAQLQLRLDEKPRRIEEAEVVVNKEAAEAIAQQNSGVQFDSFYGDLGVKTTRQ
jgi:2'-5' RNA ligase